MLTIMIPRHHKIGDTVPVRINMKPAQLTWVDEDTLIINGTDRRKIIVREDAIDGAGRPCHSFVATASQADIAAGEAPDELTITTPDGEYKFASDPLHRQPHASVGPDSHGHGRHRHGIWPQIEAKAREKSS